MKLSLYILLFWLITFHFEIYAQCTFTASINSSTLVSICGLDSITLVAEPKGDLWTQKATLAGTSRIEAVGFSIGNKGYIGTGRNDNTGIIFKDFWEYDPNTDTWSQRANFGGGDRSSAVGFSIGNKGYIGTGSNGSGGKLKDFWEYDPVTNIWTQKADFGGGGRSDAFGFSIGNKGYIGTGDPGGSNYFNDFWEYDQGADIWSQKANFPYGRSGAVAFVIGNIGYAGLGKIYGGGPQTYFSYYNPINDAWYGVSTGFPYQARENAFGFSIGGKGYIGSGNNYLTSYSDFIEFDPVAHIWIQRANCYGTHFTGSVGFSIGNKGYVGAAWISADNFWEYDQYYDHIWSNGISSPTISVHSAGIYSVNITDFSGCLSSATQIVVDCIGINELTNDDNIRIYPNPTSDILNLEIEQMHYITILNALGNEVYTGKMEKGTNKINLNDLEDGLYLIKIKNYISSKYFTFIKNQK